jgi:ATP-dependent DNA ligase
MQIIRNRTQYDVCVIGSGAGGGMAAMVLTEAGANVVMLEAGPFWDASLDTAMYKWSRFAGRVGSGFNDKTLASVGKELFASQRDTSPFADQVPYREARFVEPSLVAQVQFSEWTHLNTLRHPVFKGLRADKDPRSVVRET